MQRSGDVAKRVGLAASTASYHLTRLAEAGLVERTRGRHAAHWRVEDRIAALVERVA